MGLIRGWQRYPARVSPSPEPPSDRDTGQTSTAETVRRHVETSVVEDDVLRSARARADDLGVGAVSPSVCTALEFLARVIGARTVVEVGTGAGVSGTALLRGMHPDGVLTTIDSEPEHQRAARTAFSEAGFASGRVRLINGRALDVLPRLTDAGYDLILVDPGAHGRTDHPDYLRDASRLLRPGGVVVLHGVLVGAAVADPARRDAATVALRETVRTVTEDEHWTPLLLPLGDGVLVATLAAPGT